MVVVEVIAIGNEVLTGSIINSNAAFISQELFKAGFSISQHTVLEDDENSLFHGLKEALNRSAIVICTGGLGSTCDDLTRQAAAKLFESDFIFHEKLADDLQKRYGKLLATINDQASVPRKATLIENSLGTAPGLIFYENNQVLILMPGVPMEMKPMMVKQVIPFLLKEFPSDQFLYREKVNFFELSEAAVDPLLRRLKAEHPNVEFGIYPSYGIVSVTVTLRTSQPEEAKILKLLCEIIENSFPLNVFEAESGKIQEAIQRELIRRKLTLSIAESCTGGAIGASLTKFPGASAYFLGSLVTYSNVLKEKILGVKKEALEKYGAVSEEVVREMWEGLMSLTSSDYGIAITGIAGPSGGTAEKPIGTVWAAVGERDESPFIWKFRGGGSREIIIERSINAVLGKLYQKMKTQNSLNRN